AAEPISHEVHSLSSHHRPLNKGGGEGQLCSSQGECLTRQLFWNTFNLVQHLARLDLGYPVLDAALTFTHTNFEGLFGNRLVREHTDPDFTATLDVTSQGTTGRFDLTSSQATTRNSFQGEFAEADLATAMSQTTVVAGHLLAEFCTLGLQHVAYSLLSSFLARRRSNRLGLFQLATDDLALEDPHLHTDHTVGGVRLVGGVIDIGTQGVQRHTTFAIPLGAGDFRTAETTAHLNLDALGTNAHGVLHGALHGATEHDAAFQLLSNALSNQHCIEFRL